MFKVLGRQLQWELTNTKIIEKLDALIEELLDKVKCNFNAWDYKILDCQ